MAPMQFIDFRGLHYNTEKQVIQARRGESGKAMRMRKNNDTHFTE